MRALPKAIKCPTKSLRWMYKKLFILYTTIEIFNVTVGALLAQVITFL